MFHKRPYIVSTIIAIVLAIMVWSVVPKEYAAVTKVSDEYKELDLAIGLTRISAKIRDALNAANEGINDIEVYCKALKTEDFARALSKTVLPGKHMTYGQWVMEGRHFWQTKDTIELISDNIEYNISTKHQTLTIQFTDRDPLVASFMLDATTNHLQDIVTEARHKTADAALKNADVQRKEALRIYHEAQKEYATYSDTHFDPQLNEEIQKQKSLEDAVTLAYKQYQTAAEQYIRQISLRQRTYCSFAVIKSNVVPEKDTSHLWIYIVTFIMFALAGVKGYRLLKKRIAEHSGVEGGGVFSPWTLTMLVWGGMISLLMVAGDTLYPLTEQFYIAIVLWISIFVVTSFTTFNLLSHDTKPLPTDGIDINKSFFYLLFIAAVILSPLYMYKVYHIVAMFGTKDMMKSIRELAVFGEGQGVPGYAIVISQSLLLVSFWRYPKMPLWQVIVVICCCLISSLAIMEKGGIFLALFCGMYVMFERKVIRMRTFVTVGCLAVVGLYLFNLMREGVDSNYSKNESLMDFVGMYIMSPPVAFCRVLQDITDQPGVNTFEVVYDYLQRFGFGPFDVHEKVQEFVFVPISTNVYTVMQPFYRDFGYLGVAFFAWVYGLVSGVAYRYSRNGDPYFICIYTYIVELLVLQFYQDSLFLSLSFNIQLAVIVFFCTYTKLKVNLSRKNVLAVQ